jgi:hypothetical protein
MCQASPPTEQLWLVKGVARHEARYQWPSVLAPGYGIESSRSKGQALDGPGCPRMDHCGELEADPLRPIERRL